MCEMSSPGSHSQLDGSAARKSLPESLPSACSLSLSFSFLELTQDFACMVNKWQFKTCRCPAARRLALEARRFGSSVALWWRHCCHVHDHIPSWSYLPDYNGLSLVLLPSCRQLILLLDLYSAKDIYDYLRPIAFSLCADKVSSVRCISYKLVKQAK